MELIKHENHNISGSANDAKKKLERLAKVDLTTKMSGYELQILIHI